MLVPYRLIIGTPASVPIKFDSEETQTDLSTRTELTSGNAYSIRVFATNDIGQSNSSNEIEYTKPQGQLIKVKELN